QTLGGALQMSASDPKRTSVEHAESPLAHYRPTTTSNHDAPVAVANRERWSSVIVTDASDGAVATIPASAKCASYFLSVGHDCSVFRCCTSGQVGAREQAFDKIVARLIR